MAMTLADLPNPYEFSKPVTERSRFAGRNDELEDIGYYLKLATRTPQPVNLAIIGERASGKTSLLNIIDIEATQSGLLTARINLNSGDAEPVNLFWKLYDAVVEAAIAGGHLFRPGSDEDGVYRQLIDSLDITADRPSFPLRFPAHYARAVTGGRQISETKLQHDLSYISADAGTNFVLLFDECNVLATNRVALEMLRNVFMNTPGYMLVLTGTPSLFPLLDDVFSPIIRQFKKVHITAFSNTDDTEACIYNPLKSLSLNPDNIIAHFITRDIHALSGGRPYEIQLLCHLMFRRVQQERAQKMNLTADVIDDVLRELETTIKQSASDRPIIASVRKLSDQQLRALRIFGRCTGDTTFDQVWFMHVIDPGVYPFSREALSEALREFVSLGILSIKEDTQAISFAGNEFDQTYLRYHAERLGEGLSIRQIPFERGLSRVLHEALRSISLTPIMSFPGGPPLDQAVAMLIDTHAAATESAGRAYTAVYKALTCGRLILVKIRVTYDEMPGESWLSYAANEYTELCHNPDYLSLSEVAALNHGELSYLEYAFDLPSEEDFFEHILSSGNRRLLSNFGTLTSSWAAVSYFGGKRDEALLNANRAARFQLSGDAANSIGYIKFALGERDEATRFFKESFEIATKNDDFKVRSYSLYNQAIASLASGHKDAAIDFLRLAVSGRDSHPDTTINTGCLFIPKSVDGTVALCEVRKPELFASVEEALALLYDVELSSIPPEVILNENLDEDSY